MSNDFRFRAEKNGKEEMSFWEFFREIGAKNEATQRYYFLSSFLARWKRVVRSDTLFLRPDADIFRNIQD